MIRITFALRRKQNLEFEEFQEYWREKHGPLVASHSSHLKIRRYVQVHTLGNPDAERPEGERGKMQRPFDGVAELWFDSLDDIRNSDSAAVDASLELLE
ncbi:MAG TPA: EthD domain-containing protein, partial [Pseudomonadales bacterium]|nr:EthD domain-containing protein [Pseudomonadales bacterium]